MTLFDTPIDRRTFVKIAAVAGAGAAAGSIALAGCTEEQGADSPSTGEAADDQASERPPASSDSAPREPSATLPATGSALVVVFSRSGNTLKVAERIASATGLDVFRIETAEAYPDDYDTVLDQARREQSEGVLPELAGGIDGWESYDTVLFGFPTWWSHVPPAVEAFLRRHDLGGKTVAPFNTSGSSGFASTLSDIAEICPEATLLEGLALYADTVDSALDQVEPWIAGLGLEL